MSDELASDAAPARVPRVPRLEAARALVWLVLAALALWMARGPADLPQLAARRDASGACVLSTQASAPPCPCSELPSDLRRVLGLPLSLARASAAELESLPGIGPHRAR